MVLERAYLEIDDLEDGGAPVTVWKNLTGIDPPAKSEFKIGADKDLQSNAEVLQRIQMELTAGNNIALLTSDNASTLTAKHGYAVLSLAGGVLKLYDPLFGERELAIGEFNFIANLKSLQIMKTN